MKHRTGHLSRTRTPIAKSSALHPGGDHHDSGHIVPDGRITPADALIVFLFIFLFILNVKGCAYIPVLFK